MNSSKKSTIENPRRGANLLSQLFFVWTVPLLWKGMKNGLSSKDLTKCLEKFKSEALADNLEREWKRELETASKNKKKPQLWRALIQVDFWEFVVSGLLFLTEVVLRTSLALILGQLLVQFQKRTVQTISVNATELKGNKSFMDTDIASMTLTPVSIAHYVWNDDISLATLLVIFTLICNLILHQTLLELRIIGTKKRIACSSLIYRKSICLSASAANEIGTGHIVNLMSNDVARLDNAVANFHAIWILPIQAVIVAYLLWQQIGWIGIVAVICLLAETVPVQTYLGRLKSLLRKKVASRTDERIGIVNEIVQGIQVIKMYAWEIPFQKVIASARRMEIKQIRLMSYVNGISGSSFYFVGRSTLFISIILLALTGQQISADIVFPMVRFFHPLVVFAGYLYPLAISCGGEALISLKRIEEFLLKEEKDHMEDCTEKRKSIITSGGIENAVELNDVTASWEENSNINTLNEINLKIKSGQLCAVIGPVGGGKSSLIQLLLGELSAQSGEINVNGTISYAAQEPWVFSGTVRNNILFGQSYDRKRYNEVVKCCALTTDFEQLPYGDRTFVGDRGASLSGGQRARISLARAMYKTASIYLLDDPLSAVDAHVGKHLFDEVIGPRAQIAQNAIRILVTHQIHLLKEADVIVIMENGRITNCGTYVELSNTQIDFGKLLQEHKKDENKEKKLNDEILNQVGQVYEDNQSETEFNDNNTSNGAQYKPLKLRTESISKSSMASQEFGSTHMKEEEQVKGSFSWKMFTYYFSIGSSRYQLLCLILMFVSAQCVIGGTDYFINYFTYQEFQRVRGADDLLTQTEYLFIYGALIILIIVFCTLRSIFFYSVCMRSSKMLHDKMFSAILHAPMQFFDSTPSGRLLNRISTDMGTIDDLMPPTMIDALDTTINLCGILVIIIIVNPTMIASFLISSFLYVLIYKLYIRASQDLKRLQGICRSPIFSHLAATMNGLTTIRSFNNHRKLCHEFDELQDVHSSVSYLSLASAEWFGLFMDIVSTLFLACVIYSFVFIYDNSFSGNVGLGISQALGISGLAQHGMRQLTDAIQQVTSVERIVQYIGLKPEHSPSQMPPLDWPSGGNVKMVDMSLRYDPESEPSLKNISLEIQSGSKIGVVGRTGAGKSSVIAALFQLTNTDGLIEIDNVNTKTISLSSLRSKISIIPQNPVLFAGSLRRNLDPFEEYSDDDIWKSLENVQMKDVISLSDGLNMPVTAHGNNFSVGQRQLLCLARAILRSNHILVLDEATANVDPLTDQLIQKTIREKFADCTVITIAHRLHTIIDSDRILVMDAGKCVEFDTPFNLLSTEGGIFNGMIKALGDKEYNRLYNIANSSTKK